MTLDHKNPVLRVVPGPSDINANGHIFGGWVLSQMDIAAGIVASRRADGSVATIAIERMELIAPIHLRDVNSPSVTFTSLAPRSRVATTSIRTAIEERPTRSTSA